MSLQHRRPELKTCLEPVDIFRNLAGTDILKEFYEGRIEKKFEFQLRVLICNLESVMIAIETQDSDCICVTIPIVCFYCLIDLALQVWNIGKDYLSVNLKLRKKF